MAIPPSNRIKILVTGQRGGLTAAVTAALDAAVVSAQAAGENAEDALISIGNATALTVPIGLATDLVVTNDRIVATQRRILGKDEFPFIATTGHFANFPFGARVFGSWNATHRGMRVPLTGQPASVYEVFIPAGAVIGANNAIIYIGIITPTAPLPLSVTPVTFTNPRVCGMIDLTALPAQTLPEVQWRGSPVDYVEGDLLVYWGPNVKFVYGTNNLGAGPPASNAYDGNFHIVYDIPGANDGTALGTGFTVTPEASTGASARQFPYSVAVAAGPVRSGMGGPASYALIGNDGKIIGDEGSGSSWAEQAVGIMGTSIETATGGVDGQTGWVPQTLTALGAIGTVGGVGSSLFCYIGDQGGGGDKLSFSATPAELSSIGGDPANSYRSKCYDKGFKLLVIGGGVINDVTRNTDSGALCAIGTPTDTSPNTIWGAFNRVIPDIQTNSPLCQIVIEGVQHGIQSRSGSITAPASRVNYNEALRAIAKAYKLPFLDFLNMSGVSLQNYTSRLANQSASWIHPIQMQQDQMTRQATEFLNGV